MKKILLILAVTITSQLLEAQTVVTDSTVSADGVKRHGKLRPSVAGNMKALNLTEEQKAKMKAIKEANKAQKDAVMADATLTDAQRKTKLKQIHDEQAAKIHGMLSEEQNMKLKEIKERRKKAKHAGDKAITKVDAAEAPVKQ